MRSFRPWLLVILVGCSQPASEHSLMEVDDTNFAAMVLKSDQPVLVDFWAPWCGPCLQLTPVVEELAAEFQGRAKVVKLNVDNAPQTAQQYEVSAIPLLLFFKEGEVVKQLLGVQSKEMLADVLNSL